MWERARAREGDPKQCLSWAGAGLDACLDCVLRLEVRDGLMQLLHLACVRLRLLLCGTERSAVQLRGARDFRLRCRPCVVHLVRALQVLGHDRSEVLLQHGQLLLQLLHAPLAHGDACVEGARSGRSAYPPATHEVCVAAGGSWQTEYTRVGDRKAVPSRVGPSRYEKCPRCPPTNVHRLCTRFLLRASFLRAVLVVRGSAVDEAPRSPRRDCERVPALPAVWVAYRTRCDHVRSTLGGHAEGDGSAST
jgi:hypothetical protein